MRQVSLAGSHTAVTGYELDWFFPLEVTDVEYCYPGAYTTVNGVQTYSSTICLLTDNSIRTISQTQVCISISVGFYVRNQ